MFVKKNLEKNFISVFNENIDLCLFRKISDLYLMKIQIKKYAMNNANKSAKRKEKNKHNKIKYLLAWMYPSMEEYFRNQRNFHFFEM